MARVLKQHYGPCAGPLGIPCLDRQARALEALLHSLPREDERYAPGHLIIGKATSELLPGERADVSWISTEDVDRQREIVRAQGMNDDHFQLNPVVTLNHAYDLPPVGRSLWRKRVTEGVRVGIKAKTHYPPRPENWPDGVLWYPDHAFTLVQQGLLCGKSIGFLPTKVRTPTDEEKSANPALRTVWRIVEEWVLLEYACVLLPAQPHAIVEAVSKGLPLAPEWLGIPDPPTPLPFVAPAAIAHHLEYRLESIDFHSLAETICLNAWSRFTGQV